LDRVPVAVAVRNFDLEIWDLSGGMLLHKIRLPVRPSTVAFAPGGELVVGAGYEVIVLER
ncbi:hypothetical protein ACWDNT_22080, partial [Streptomyces sp. NPDC000963]